METEKNRKPCSKCGCMKPLTEFHKNTNGGKDGHRADCKVCHTAAAMAWAKRNKERTNQYAMRYYYKNKEAAANKKNNKKATPKESAEATI